MFDILIAGGRLIDPSQALDGAFDLAIENGRVAAIVPRGQAVVANQRIEASGRLVIPGMIDTHAHVFQHVTGRFGLEADLCGVYSGVTTLIDQGGPSCITLPAFREYVVEAKKSRVYSYLSTYLVGGLEGHFYPSLYRPDCIDVAATVKSALANADIVKGFKAHAEVGGIARWGLDVMRRCAEIGRAADRPLYIHFGQLWPMPGRDEPARDREHDADTVLEAVVPLLKAGDILAHPFTRHPGGFVDRAGRVHPVVRDALAAGLKIDVGHGSHFSFRMARIALAAGIVPHTLGADMHGYNTPAPQPPGTPDAHADVDHMFFGKQRFSLASTMTSMLALGVPLADVVRMVTCNPVEIFGLPAELGSLRPGNPADVSVLFEDHGRFPLTDNEGTTVVTQCLLRPAFCLLDGVRYDASAAILPRFDRLAA
ncbi:MAG: amidohydrolase/deacetylase family metallohydrolase [Proteobacteria bacterium]|nr:amidohydrolase/deacetylase family metallohydrolase [Burkholderiales bacterium]